MKKLIASILCLMLAVSGAQVSNVSVNSNTKVLVSPTAAALAAANPLFVITSGSYANPAWVTSLASSKVLASQAGNAGKYLTTNGTVDSWATVATGLTIGTTAISGAAANDILISNGTVLQKVTPGANVLTFLATPSSANLRAAITDESGLGALLFQNGDIGAASGTSLDVTGQLTGETVTASGGLSGDTLSIAMNAFEVNNAGVITAGVGTGLTGTAAGLTAGNATLAATATALQSARTIGGSSFDGTANVTSFPVPGAIGGTTPSTGAFTGLTATSLNGAPLSTAATFAAGTMSFGSLVDGSEAEHSTAFGYHALNVVTNGDSNTALGFQAAMAITEGAGNTAVGSDALTANQSGNDNTAVGLGAMYNATGSGTVALGAYAGYYETDGNRFYVDNQFRTNLADQRAKALLYGTFAATAAAQQLTVNAGTITLNGSAVTATSFAGAGSALTALNADNLASGTVPVARLSFTLAQLNTAVSDDNVAGLAAANTFTAKQTITQASANAGILSSTGYSLTGSNATNALDFAGTWNTSGAPSFLKVRVTNTASSAYASYIIDFGTASTKYLYMSGEGRLWLGAGGIYINEANGMISNNTGNVGFNTSPTGASNNSVDLGLTGTRWRTLYVGTSIVNGGTLDVTGTTTLTGQTIHGAPTRLKAYTVATLPAGTQGDTAFVTNALAPAAGVTVVTGGAAVRPVFFDGATWVSFY